MGPKNIYFLFRCQSEGHLKGIWVHPGGQVALAEISFVSVVVGKNNNREGHEGSRTQALCGSSLRCLSYCTVKFVVDAAAPPFVVILTLPVTAPVGTTALTCVSEFTVKVAFTPPIVTTVA